MKNLIQLKEELRKEQEKKKREDEERRIKKKLFRLRHGRKLSIMKSIGDNLKKMADKMPKLEAETKSGRKKKMAEDEENEQEEEKKEDEEEEKKEESLSEMSEEGKAMISPSGRI